jgi:hypothetical protein
MMSDDREGRRRLTFGDRLPTQIGYSHHDQTGEKETLSDICFEETTRRGPGGVPALGAHANGDYPTQNTEAQSPRRIPFSEETQRLRSAISRLARPDCYRIVHSYRAGGRSYPVMSASSVLHRHDATVGSDL